MENPYKMSYHIEPACGLLNDPNGLVQFHGTYYFFHQWNRFALDHSYKEWGLFTSPDMIHWENRGSAILPDREEDEHGVHSGSAVVYDEKLYIFYTGSNKENGIPNRQSRNIPKFTLLLIRNELVNGTLIGEVLCDLQVAKSAHP